MPTLTLVALLGLVAFDGARVQAPDAGASSRSARTAQSPASPPADSGVVAVPEPSEKAVRYYRSGNVLWIVQTLFGLLIPAAFLFSGLSGRIRHWATRLGRRWFFVIGFYFIIFSILDFVIELPLSYYADFVREHAYGLSNQTLEKWVSDQVKGLMVGLVIGVLFLWIPYLLLRRSPRRWWLWTGLAVIPFLFLTLLVQPIWIDPLFNDFGPMRDKALEADILRLAARAGIEGGRVYEVNKSVDTKHLNAYVAGVGATKRIVLWDTAIQQLNKRELLVVMGHEMGHYALGHIWKLIVVIALVIMVTLFAIHRTAKGLIERYRDRFGFSELSDIASLPLILVLFSAYSLIVTPILFSYTRNQEHEADRFGLEITQDNHAAATAFVKFVTNDLDYPRPGLLVKLWRHTHPTTGDRIGFANEYRPWETNQPLKYEHLFLLDKGR